MNAMNECMIERMSKNMCVCVFCDPRSPHTDYPLLKGNGAEIRHLMLILLQLWQRHMSADAECDRHVESAQTFVQFSRLAQLQECLLQLPVPFASRSIYDYCQGCDTLLTPCHGICQRQVNEMGCSAEVQPPSALGKGLCRHHSSIYFVLSQ